MKSIFFIPLAALMIGCESMQNAFAPVESDTETTPELAKVAAAAKVPVVASITELGVVSKPPTVLEWIAVDDQYWCHSQSF